MEIKTFYPLIITPKPDEVVKRMETFGFSLRHAKEDVGGGKTPVYVMKTEDGHRVAIAGSPYAPQSFVAINMNVDSFAETVAQLEAEGFKNMSAGVVETGSSHTTMLMSPEGVCFGVAEHIKD